jgi:conserved hypothetical protein
MRIILATAAACLACSACQSKPEAAATSNETAETKAIEKIEGAQIAAISRTKDANAASSLYSTDAVFIDEKGQPTRGHDHIAKGFKTLLADPALKLAYTPGPKTFSSSGDMAYSTAEFTETFTDPATKKTKTIKGTNLSVWHKEADGNWRLVADSNPAEVTG